MVCPGEPIAPLLNTNPAQTRHHQTSQLATSPAHFPVTVVGGENVAPGYNTVPAQVRRYCLHAMLDIYTIYISTDRRAREPPPDRAAAAAPAADRRPDHPAQDPAAADRGCQTLRPSVRKTGTGELLFKLERKLHNIKFKHLKYTFGQLRTALLIHQGLRKPFIGLRDDFLRSPPIKDVFLFSSAFG